MQNNTKTIQNIEKLLAEYKFSNQDYVISLTGPTVILTESGKKKYDENLCIKADLIDAGAGSIIFL